MSPSFGRTGTPPEGTAGSLADTSRRRRAYRLVQGLGTSAAQIRAAGLPQGHFDDAGRPEDESEPVRKLTSLDEAFRAAEEDYGEHGGASASWPSRPAVAWSQSVGSPFAEEDANASSRSQSDDAGAWDPTFASLDDFPHTPEIGAFSAFDSRRLYGRTPHPVVARPMAFRPDVIPPSADRRPALHPQHSAPASPAHSSVREVNAPQIAGSESVASSIEESGLVEVPPDEPHARLPNVGEATRIFILSSVENGEPITEPSVDRAASEPIASTEGVPEAPTEEAAAVTPEAPPGQANPALPSAAEACRPTESPTGTSEAPDAAPLALIPVEETRAAAPVQAAAPTGALAASVLTSPARFAGEKPSEPRPEMKRQWRLMSLIFGLSTAATVTAGVLVLGPGQNGAPWLRATLEQMGISKAIHRAQPAAADVARPEIARNTAPAIQAPPPIEPAQPAPPRATAEQVPPGSAPQLPPALHPTDDAAPSEAPSATAVTATEALTEIKELPEKELPEKAPSATTLNDLPSHADAAVPSLIGAAPPVPDLGQRRPGQAPVAEEQGRPQAPIPPSVPRHRTPVTRPAAEARSRPMLRSRPTAARRQVRSAELDALNGQAEMLLASGRLAEARTAFRRAAAAGDPRGARGVARTYDEEIIARSTATGTAPDREKSKLWYSIANTLESRRATAPSLLPEDLR